MFVHQSRLKHVLPPECYWKEEFHQLELAQVFQSTWHLVASKSDIPNVGDFLTLELLDKPLIIRNFGDQIHTFLNVCGHRHCMLTNEPKGNSPRLRCQYHGWEYDEDGRTGRIPEAKCFAPWERDRAHLPKFRTECCGELIFVSLDPHVCSLETFLGAAKFEEGQAASLIHGNKPGPGRMISQRTGKSSSKTPWRRIICLAFMRTLLVRTRKRSSARTIWPTRIRPSNLISSITKAMHFKSARYERWAVTLRIPIVTITFFRPLSGHKVTPTGWPNRSGRFHRRLAARLSVCSRFAVTKTVRGLALWPG